MPGDSTPYDTLIVGSGPGGATVARQLALAGQRVLVLEWGRADPVTGRFRQALRELFTPGRSLLFTEGLTGLVRAVTVGGSTIYYYGTAFEPPFEMLARHGLDIREEVSEAHAELPIAPLPERLLGERARRIGESARGLGLDWKPLPKFIDASRCASPEPLGYYAAPAYEAKWNARMWIDEAVAHGATLQTGARVERVLVERSVARGVVYVQAGRRREARAERVVIAAGGIGSPQILTASGLEGAGRDFFVDPLVSVVGEVEELDARPEIPMSTGVHCADDGYVMTDLCVPESLFVTMTAQVGRLHKLRAHRRSLQIMVKIRDELGGRITERGRVRKGLSAGDRARLAHGAARARSILAGAGARGIYQTAVIAAHPGGTVKVGELLDENLRTRIENLYVCDCSVIPEAWGLPPTLTLIGLGKRLARHLLAGRERGRAAAIG